MRLNIKNCKALCQPDPYIIKEDNKFYIFTTGEDGVYCYASENLLGDYNDCKIVFSRKGYKEYWAPEVIKIKDTFYMYVSCVKNNSTDCHEQKLIVASSLNILGPYKYENDLAIPFSIDANPVINETGMYMFYSINDYESSKAGTRIVVDKMISPTKLEGNPKVVINPTIKQEIFMKDRFKTGQDWYTIEGACYFYENGIHYLLYSANCYMNEDYFVGYAYSNSKELDLTKIEFKKYPSDNEFVPLLCKNDFESGTGHNSLIKHENQWYIVYHGRDLDEENASYDNRSMRIAKLNISKNFLNVKRKKIDI